MYCGHQRRHCGSNPENADQAASARPAISVRSSAVSTGPSTGAVIRLKRKDAPQIAASSTRRAVSAGLIARGSGLLFERQQLLLALEPPRVAAEAAVGS